jgi:hypothetical protein
MIHSYPTIDLHQPTIDPHKPNHRSAQTQPSICTNPTIDLHQPKHRSAQRIVDPYLATGRPETELGDGFPDNPSPETGAS